MTQPKSRIERLNDRRSTRTEGIRFAVQLAGLLEFVWVLSRVEFVVGLGVLVCMVCAYVNGVLSK